ncbi:exopolysaccharide biosynthesis protein [Yoonia sp.]|uniref:exopolysaccharide biosynthesis protein n=1 Tax=Yoonia sp. TaxID=2212373 RepID=UPI002E04D7E6|nr:exopolysaccharide biosynthesis protein [Yoonia sp.]
MIQKQNAPSAAPKRFRSRTLARTMVRLNRGRELNRQMSVGEISDRLSQLGPLYLLMAIACVAVSPLSGIPLVTTACGLSIAALAIQLLLGWRTTWLPARLRRKTIHLQRLNAGLQRADWVAGRIETVFSRRWIWLTRGPTRVLLLCNCIALGLAMPFLEIVPFAGTAFASVVLVIAMAFILRDGLAALVSGLLVCAAVVVAGLQIVGS